MKFILLLPFIFNMRTAFADCQAPGQGYLEGKVKETFYVTQGEAELKEWVGHPKNAPQRAEIKNLDSRSKFAGRLQKGQLLVHAQENFDLMISNTERESDMQDFPSHGARSKLMSSLGTIDIEMSNLSKEGLDVFPPNILAKLSPKVKIKYFYPYDKFEYFLTYGERELAMGKALGLIQQEMEETCELRVIENKEYRQWYEKDRSGTPTSSKRSSQQ